MSLYDKIIYLTLEHLWEKGENAIMFEDFIGLRISVYEGVHNIHRLCIVGFF